MAIVPSTIRHYSVQVPMSDEDMDAVRFFTNQVDTYPALCEAGRTAIEEYTRRCRDIYAAYLEGVATHGND